MEKFNPTPAAEKAALKRESVLTPEKIAEEVMDISVRKGNATREINELRSRIREIEKRKSSGADDGRQLSEYEERIKELENLKDDLTGQQEVYKKAAETFRKLDQLKKEIEALDRAIGSGELSNTYGKMKPGEVPEGFDRFDFEDPQGWAEKEVAKREALIKELERRKGQVAKEVEADKAESENRQKKEEIGRLKKEIGGINRAIGSGELADIYGKMKPEEPWKGFDRFDFEDPQGWAEKEVAKREKRIKELEEGLDSAIAPADGEAAEDPGKGAIGMAEGESSKDQNPETVLKGGRIINIDEIVKSFAWQIAEKKVRELLHKPEEEMRSGNSKFRSIMNNLTAPFRHPVEFAKKAWVRAGESGYLYKFYNEALEEITSNQNLLLEIEASARLGRPISARERNTNKAEHFEILDSILRQYSNEVAEEEERGNRINDPNVETALRALIVRSRDEGWDRARFEREQRTVLNQLRTDGHLRDTDFIGGSGARSLRDVQEGSMFVTDLWNLAESYKAHIDQKIAEYSKDKELSPEDKKKIEEHVKGMMQLDISLGAKLSDLHNRRPADTLSRMERFVQNTQRIPILGRIASNPVFMAAAGGVTGRAVMKAIAAAGLGTAGVVTGAWIPVLAAAASAGVYGAMRRNMEMKKDRGMHQREKILGGEFSDFRRRRMDEFEYDIRSTGDLMQELEQIQAAGSFEDLTPAQRGQLASMFARIKVELQRDTENRRGNQPNRTVDLISVSSEEGKKYGTTVMSKTDLKIALYDYLRRNNLIDQQRSAPLDNQEFNGLFNAEVLRLNDNIDRADRAFDSHRRRSALAMGSLAGLAGGLGAIVGQEVAASLSQNPNYTSWDSLKDTFGTGPRKIDESMAAVFVGGTKLKPGVNEVMMGGKSVKLTVDQGGTFIRQVEGLPEGYEPKLNKQGFIEGFTRQEVIRRVSIAGHELKPGRNELVIDGHDVPVTVSQDGGMVTKINQRDLPPGWSFKADDSGRVVSLVKETAGGQEVKTFRADQWEQFAKQSAGQDVSRRVSYQKFFHEGPGTKSRGTELMMHFKQNRSGEFIVDAKKMLGHTLKGPKGTEGVDFSQALKDGKIFVALSPDHAHQNNPILLEMGRDGSIKIPENLKSFFSVDAKGNVKGKGLIQVVYDSGMTRSKDGAAIMRPIAAIKGDNITELQGTVAGNGGVQEALFQTKEWRVKSVVPLDIETKSGTQFDTPWGIPVAAPVSRWQLEDERKPEGRRDQTDGQKIDDIMSGRGKRTASTDIDELMGKAFAKGREEKGPVAAGASPEMPPGESDSGKAEAKEGVPAGERGSSEEEWWNLYDDKMKRESAWDRYKKDFHNLDGLEKIIGEGGNPGRIFNKLIDMEALKKEGRPVDQDDEKMFKDFYEKYKAANPEISFSQFMACLKVGTEALRGISGRKRVKREEVPVA